MSAPRTMDFFAHQDATKRATRRLVVLFAISVACIVAGVSAVAVAAFSSSHVSKLEVVIGAAAVTLAVIAIGSLARMAQLRHGGAAVAQMLGGREVDPGTRDASERRFVNVVEEMAIASGTPVPRMFVLDEEGGINAFAAGWNARDAAVAVTRGALEQLDRDELQGVVAHEFSHVFHGDMRLNTRLIGVLAGIVCLVSIGEVLLRSMRHSRGRKNDGAAAIAALGIALMAIGSIGAFFAGLIKAAVSRQREYLADSSAVAYTRNPLGIGRALWRIGKSSGSIQRAGAREASHMFFADGFTHWLGSLGATHPPVAQRIERVMPGYLAANARGAGSEFLAAKEAEAKSANVAAPASAAAFAGAAGFAGAEQTRTRNRAVGANDAVSSVGSFDAAAIDSARQLLASLPLDVAAAAHDARRAPALLLALAFDRDPKQTAQLPVLDEATAHDARNLAAQVRSLPMTARLPLAELCAPRIATLDEQGREALLRELRALAHADGEVTAFEMALLFLAERSAAGPHAQRTSGRMLHLGAALSEIETVLSWMAHAGGGDAAAAFQRSRDALPGIPPLQLQPDIARVRADAEHSVARLDRLAPQGKRLLLHALATIAAHDGAIAPAEGELLRALAACWGCPMPPLWSGRDD